MQINLADLSSNQIYFLMTQTIVPRPIAWVLSGNETGSYNLAPFSYFNAVASDPPTIMLSIGFKPTSEPKDTRRNLMERKEFVLHIPSEEQLQAVNASAESLPANESEVDKLNLPLVPFGTFALPRLADCRIAMACRYQQCVEIGAGKQALILAEIEMLWVEDSCIEQVDMGRYHVDASKIRPLARLGRSDYAGLGTRLQATRKA